MYKTRLNLLVFLPRPSLKTVFLNILKWSQMINVLIIEIKKNRVQFTIFSLGTY